MSEGQVSLAIARRVAVPTLLMLASMLATSCTSSLGLAIQSPKHGKSVDQNSIVLQWEPPEEPGEEVRYELMIWQTGKPVYRADEIEEPRHVVATPLPPGRYSWQVRAIQFRDGQWERGLWSRRRWTYYYVVFVTSGEGPYEFEVVQPR
jgi:hypothetical protein